MLRLLFISIFLFSIPESFAVFVDGPKVKVRIGKSLRNIQVSGLDLKRHLYFNNDTKRFNGKKTVKFNCETMSSLNKEKNKPVLLATLESSTGLLSFEKEKFIHNKFYKCFWRKWIISCFIF